MSRCTSRRNASRKFLVLFVALGGAIGAQSPQLLLDLNRDSLPSVGSDPDQFTRSGNRTFFAASTSSGRELHVSDGTAANTRLVRDIVPGPGSSDPRFLTDVAGQLFFVPRSANTVWRSDGTTAGTVATPLPFRQVRGMWPLMRNGTQPGVVIDGVDPIRGREVSFTDGTLAGTVTLDLQPGLSDGLSQFLGVAGRMAYFVGPSGGRFGLWRTDFGPNGTVFLGGGSLRTVTEFAASGNTAYLGGPNGLLFRSTGSPSSTVQLLGMMPRVSDLPRLIATRRGLWVFETSRAIATTLWHVAAGSRQAVRLTLPYVIPGDIVELPGKLDVVFQGSDPSSAGELWISDGTIGGTRLLRDLQPAASSKPEHFRAFGSTVVFAATTQALGRELWVTDGTSAGTRSLSDLRAGPLGSDPEQFGVTAGGELWFRANDGKRGSEPWILDRAGARLVADVAPPPPGSFGSDPEFGVTLTTPRGTRSLFAATEVATGREPWITDGTPAGTSLLSDIVAGASGSNPRGFVRLGNQALFGVDGALWISDGTAAGTRRVAAVPMMPDKPELTPIRNGAVFVASDPTRGSELWRTDGTTAGTGVLLDLAPGRTGSVPSGLTRVGERIFFAATTPSAGRELWVTDGTVGGTRIVRDLAPGPGSVFPHSPVRFRDRLVFFAQATPLIATAWITDGTAVGTKPLGGPRLIPAQTYSAAATADRIFLAAGSELWTSRGDAASTVRLNSSVEARDLVSLGSRIVFSGMLQNGQRELWVSDGTARGTVLIDDLYGVRSSNPSRLLVTGERYVWFRADSPTGPELWRTDGMARGSVRVGALGHPGGTVLGLGPRSVLLAGGVGPTGLEPFVVDAGACSERLGHGCGEGLRAPTCELTDCVLGRSARFAGSLVDAGAVGALIFGQGPVVSVQACRFWPGTGPTVALGVQVSAGSWQQAVPIPNNPALLGAEFLAQAAFARSNPVRVRLSNGLRLVAGR